MRWLRSGLRRKFIVVLGGLALVPVAFLGWKLTGISHRGIQTAVLELHTKLAEKLAEQVDDSISAGNEKVAFAMASVRKKTEWPDKQALLRSLIETHPDIVEVSILNPVGRELVKVYNPDLAVRTELLSRAGEEGLGRFLKERRLTAEVSREGPLPTILLYHPMTRALVVRVEVSLRRLAGRIEEERVGGTGFAVLVDGRGKPLLYPPERLGVEALREFPRWDIVLAAVQAQSVGSREFMDSGRRAYVGAYAPVRSVGCAIVTLQSREEAYDAALRMRRTALAVVLAVVALALLGAAFLARRLARPLVALARAAEAVARGDFSSRVDIATGDELQDLAETFNRMTDQLRAYSLLQVDRLIAEQRKTEAILYSINEGILMADQEGNIQLANRRALELFGLNPLLPVEGKTILEVLPDSPLRAAVLLCAAQPKPEAFKDVDLSSEQSRRCLRVLAHPVVTPGRGTALGIVVALRDVTLERELDKMKEDFLHYVTHDLRNPLSAAMGYADILLKGVPGVLNPEQHMIASSVKRSMSRLMGMVSNILDIAKMESGRVRLALKTVSLAGIAGRSISILESLAKTKKIEVRLDASEEFSLEADPDLIERVLVNLLGNAIKYAPQGGTITLSVKDQGPDLRVCVSDTGPGIPEEYLERIFLKFEQVTGQRQGGTGLGLTIAKFFIEAHLGWIWAESEPGKGSRFYFTLPKGLRADKDGAVSVSDAVA